MLLVDINSSCVTNTAVGFYDRSISSIYIYRWYCHLLEIKEWLQLVDCRVLPAIAWLALRQERFGHLIIYIYIYMGDRTRSAHARKHADTRKSVSLLNKEQEDVNQRKNSGALNLFRVLQWMHFYHLWLAVCRIFCGYRYDPLRRSIRLLGPSCSRRCLGASAYNATGQCMTCTAHVISKSVISVGFVMWEQTALLLDIINQLSCAQGAPN